MDISPVIVWPVVLPACSSIEVDVNHVRHGGHFNNPKRPSRLTAVERIGDGAELANVQILCARILRDAGCGKQFGAPQRR